jgi:hypothetical protein
MLVSRWWSEEKGLREWANLSAWPNPSAFLPLLLIIVTSALKMETVYLPEILASATYLRICRTPEPRTSTAPHVTSDLLFYFGVVNIFTICFSTQLLDVSSTYCNLVWFSEQSAIISLKS